MDEEIITQLGLILTQLRFTRRAVEDIERAAARYGGVGFATALAAGPRFGEPPMVSGALKVYVVNINDLAPGSGIGGFLEGLLGGTGRFFGGLLGGIVGGTLGGVALPFFLKELDRITQNVKAILDLLGLGTGATKAGEDKESTGEDSASGLNLEATLARLESVGNTFTALFQAASTGPDSAARSASSVGAEKWLAMLTATSAVLAGASHMVDGLIILVPILIGALSLVVSRMGDVQSAFLDMIRFLLRNTLVLRGGVLVTVYDTMAAAGRMGVTVLGILGSTLERVLLSIFDLSGTLLDLSLRSIQLVSSGLANAIDTLLRWLVDTAFVVLTRLGDTLLFRFAVHVVQVLPEVIPSLWEIRFGTPYTGPALSSRDIPQPQFSGGRAPLLPAAPDMAKLITPTVTAIAREVSSATNALTTTALGSLGLVSGSLDELNRAVEGTAANEVNLSKGLRGHLTALGTRAQTLTDALAPAADAARKTPATGLEAIAQAYETWLGTGGLDTLLDRITRHFSQGPSTGPEAASSLPGRVAAGAAGDRPRATIEIDAITIEVPPPPAGTAPEPTGALGPAPDARPELSVSMLTELFHELEERGWNPALGPLVTQVT